ncbi:cyanophycin synthetase [Leptolyngbya sp. AN02str]|uniref:ATP-binding protein n=1 Tax=Leptolyngbya sp. AN02str TaxID=3423363 RepID=UPI003D314B9A
MPQELFYEASRVNARKTDIFDIFNFRYYEGPNPYLEGGAIVFDMALTGYAEPQPIQEFVEAIAETYPIIAAHPHGSHFELFAQLCRVLSALDMDLHCDRVNIISRETGTTIAVEAIHEPTSYGLVYTAWDWFEAIGRGQTYHSLPEQMELLQRRFRRSAYGGPTVYALLRSAHFKGIPALYLPDEGLMQYGYGKKQVRGVATTFNCDSHLDSDFTTRKDDCKAFLSTLGFPVPKGDIVTTLSEALDAADRIGYPVAVKPVVGHKGIGVTAEVQHDDELTLAFDRAVQAHPPEMAIAVIVEQSIAGSDFRLLCVDGKFVAATERRPATVTGDGESTIAELIAHENAKPERLDTPTSPLGKIVVDNAMHHYLDEQRLSLDSILEPGEVVALRKVANLSSGGSSVDATTRVHPDNIVLAQDIAQHFQLICLGIDVLAADISKSWKDGNFGIIEINSAPGVYMHLRPAVGDSIDVTAKILETFFSSAKDSRIPILSFNYLPVHDLKRLIDHLLVTYPTWTIGALCKEAAFINRSEKQLSGSYNTKVKSLLRHPKLDLLIAEYDDATLMREGCFYDGSNVVVLDNPTEAEQTLAHSAAESATLITKTGNSVIVRRQGLVEQHEIDEDESFPQVYLKEILAALVDL